METTGLVFRYPSIINLKIQPVVVALTEHPCRLARRADAQSHRAGQPSLCFPR